MLRLLPLATAASRYSRKTLATAVFLGLAAAPASAQVVFDNFNDGDVSDVGVFSGGATGIGAGVGPTTGLGGADNTGLNLGINPGAGGGFAGAVVPGPVGVTNVSSQTYFSFYIRPSVQAANLPLLLEINFQEDTNGDGMFDGAVDDEFQVEYRLNSTATYQFVQIPLASFVDDNSVTAGANNGFDFTKLLQVVYAIGGIQGPPLALSFDELRFTQQAIGLAGPFTSFDNFNDGDVSDVGVFSGGATGIGAGVGPTTGLGGADNTGLNLGINPGAGGGFAGAVVPGPVGVTNVSSQTYFSFYIRPSVQAANLPLLLEINFQEDTNGDGMFDGAVDDEFQVEYRLNSTATYQFVQIPLASFVDDNSVTAGANNGFDFTKLLQVVYAIGGIQGPPLALSFDELGFTAGDTPVAATETPRAFSAAPVAFPNPTSGSASVTFELAEAQTVRVDVVDVLGRRVATLADGAQAAGPVRLAVETAALAPGVYVVRVQTATGVASTRLTVVR